MNQRPRRPKPPQSSPRRQARKPITPAEARRCATAHVINRMFKGAKVSDGAKVRLDIYPSGNWKPAEVWIVYKNPENTMALKSSDIIIVSKHTGRVLYEGSAGDEGWTTQTNPTATKKDDDDMIAYDRYTELLSKEINRTITAAEQTDVAKFEAAQPKSCPKCNAAVFSSFTPTRVIHDIEKCSVKSSGSWPIVANSNVTPGQPLGLTRRLLPGWDNLSVS